MQAKPRRFWLRFGLRSLFALVLVSAVCSAFLARYLEQKRRERAAAIALVSCNFSVAYDWELANKGQPPGPKWLKNVLGDDFFSHVTSVSTGYDLDQEM